MTIHKEQLTNTVILTIVNQSTGLQIDDPEADLIACGVESIKLLEIITIIEEEYDVELNLDKLESKNFLINANNLIYSVTKKSQ